jgi:hypothetical protein
MERSKHFVKRFSRQNCKPVTTVTLSAMWNASTEFNPGMDDDERKGKIMYYWVRVMSSNLPHWTGWIHIHSYSQGRIRIKDTKEIFLRKKWSRNYTDQSEKARQRYYDGYIDWAKHCVKDWNTNRETRQKFVDEFNALAKTETWKKYADVSVPAFDRWIKSNIELA